MSWSSPFPEDSGKPIQKPKTKILSTKQLDSIDNESTLADYAPPKTSKPDIQEKNVYETPLYEPPKSKDSELLERINYMIFLLEEQRDERTGQVTEELILYVFLGVFTIFVLDTFVKTGKYSR
jgi:hypothetical protein